jgi:hypothetical protein
MIHGASGGEPVKFGILARLVAGSGVRPRLSGTKLACLSCRRLDTHNIWPSGVRDHRLGNYSNKAPFPPMLGDRGIRGDAGLSNNPRFC